MRILVTGAAGFVGRFVVADLLSAGHRVIATSRESMTMTFGRRKLRTLSCDLLQRESAIKVVTETNPTVLIHLAARPHVGDSFKDPKALLEMNVLATGYLCEALAKLSGSRTFIFASSAMVYAPSKRPISERTRPRPANPYGESKLAAETLLRNFNDRVRLYIVRPFNHTGPGQSSKYVCSALAQRVIAAENSGVVNVGNLKAKRDFCDVRDIARAYRLIAEKQPQERLFVLGSGRAISIEDVLKSLIRISGKRIETEVDRSLFRKVDGPIFVSNPALAQEYLGWKAEIPFSKTLRDLYDSYSQRR